jgi:hypothetical protein
LGTFAYRSKKYNSHHNIMVLVFWSVPLNQNTKN